MDLHEQFQKENGMSVDTAWQKVMEWKVAGKKNEAKSGCQLILKTFPEHEAKGLLALLEAEEEAEKKNKKKT